jgi:hypothetical protein
VGGRVGRGEGGINIFDNFWPGEGRFRNLECGEFETNGGIHKLLDHFIKNKFEF